MTTIKPGTKIRITSSWLPMGYKNGDVLTVKEFIDDKSTFDGYAFAEETGNVAIMRREFEVIEEPKEAKEMVKAGDKIRITEPNMTSGHYDKGDVLTVVSEYSPMGFVRAKDIPIIIHEDEFEVLPQTLKTEKRPAKVGERIVIVNANPLIREGQTYKNGDILTVTEMHPVFSKDVLVEGQPKFIEPREYEVIVEPDLLKVGDYAVVLNADYCTMKGFNNGEVVKVIVNTHGEDDFDYKVAKLGSTNKGYIKKSSDYIRKATEAEIAKAEGKSPELKKGDRVRLLNDRLGGLIGFRTGGIYTVTNPNWAGGHDTEIFGGGTEGGVHGYTNANNLEKVVEEVKPEPKQAVSTNVQVGDSVKTKKDKRGFSQTHVGWGRPGQGVVNVGTIGKVVNVLGNGDIEVEFDAETKGLASETALKRFLLKNGEFEKVPKGQFQPGDIVLATKLGTSYYAEVIEVTGGPLAGGNHRVDIGHKIITVLGDNMVMIAPKGNRVD
jgi:hypothetical protein